MGEATQAHKTQKHMQGRSSTQQPPATAKLDFHNRKTGLPQPQNWNSATSKPANEMQKMACWQAAKQGSDSQHTGLLPLTIYPFTDFLVVHETQETLQS